MKQNAFRGKLTGPLGESSAKGDGWYWRLIFKWEDAHGNTIHITDPVTVRDDTGCGPLILNHRLWLELGEPEYIIKQGNGFGYRIQHLLITDDAAGENKWFWKVAGLDMGWIEFRPLFFREQAGVGAADLSLITTFGWKAQALLGEIGVGFLQKDYRRGIALTEETAHIGVTDIWRKK